MSKIDVVELTESAAGCACSAPGIAPAVELGRGAEGAPVVPAGLGCCIPLSSDAAPDKVVLGLLAPWVGAEVDGEAGAAVCTAAC